MPRKRPSLLIVNPVLAKEWHPKKNNKLTPSDVRPYSENKVWWSCKDVSTHEWQAKIKERTKGTGCPFCRGKRVSAENNLLLKFPEISAEWHDKLNGKLKPENFRPHSNQSFWWQCKRNSKHIWKSKINNRTSLGRGCPHCSPQSSRVEMRLLAELRSVFPEVLHRRKIYGKEADIFIPSIQVAIEVDGGFWHIKKENKDLEKTQHFEKHQITIIRLRSLALGRVGDCIYYDDKRGLKKSSVNDLLDRVSAIRVLPKGLNNQIERYKQSPGFTQIKAFQDLTKTLMSPIVGNSIAEKDKKLVNEWHPAKNSKLLPNDFYPGSNEKVWWLCKKGHEWQAAISSRSNGSGCPYCSGKLASEDYNLSKIIPKLAKEWHWDKNGSLTPRDFTPNSNKKVWWQCKGNPKHIWLATIANRANGRGCAVCAGKVATNENSLLVLFPKIAREWHPSKNWNLEPKDVVAGSHKKIWWQCRKNKKHFWKTSIKNRTKMNTGCPFCCGKVVSASHNLLIKYPKIAKEWHPSKNGNLNPNDVLPSTKNKYWWLCQQGHSFLSSTNDRSRGNGCPYCSGHRVSYENSLQTLYPELSKEWHPTKNGKLKPSDFTAGTNKRAWWQCRKNQEHVWTSIIRNRAKLGRGCPYCAGKKKI